MVMRLALTTEVLILAVVMQDTQEMGLFVQVITLQPICTVGDF